MLFQVLSAASVATTALLCVYVFRRRRIARFARQATRESRSPREAAFALGRAVFSGTKRRKKNPIFLSRLLAPLGASPVAVLEGGGCCSGLHRLFITALDTIGIPASQVTVFRRVDPVNAHCLAQVCVDSERLLIDVDYGVWLRHPNGSAVDIVGLRGGVVPVIESFVLDDIARYQDSARIRSAGYPNRDYYRFDYELTRTANWAMSPLRRVIYTALTRITRGRIDLLLLPPILEWPEVLLSIAVSAASLLALLVWIARGAP